MKANTLRHFIDLWPPFILSGIRCTRVAPDFASAEVIAPGLGTVKARIRLGDEAGELIARVDKAAHVQRKPSAVERSVGDSLLPAQRNG